MFSCEILQICKNTFFTEHLRWHWKYIFFVTKRSVKYANLCRIWLYAVANDRLVITFQKLVHTRVTLCYREFNLERRMGDIVKQRRYLMQVSQ